MCSGALSARLGKFPSELDTISDDFYSCISNAIYTEIMSKNCYVFIAFRWSLGVIITVLENAKL